MVHSSQSCLNLLMYTGSLASLRSSVAVLVQVLQSHLHGTVTRLVKMSLMFITLLGCLGVFGCLDVLRRGAP